MNGVEAWCNLPGKYVSFVRKADADPQLDDIVLCSFGVIADTSVELALSTLPNRFTQFPSLIEVTQGETKTIVLQDDENYQYDLPIRQIASGD